MRQLKNPSQTSSTISENSDSLSPNSKAEKPKLENTSGLAYPTMWKRAFAIGQNVRFTRTPEVELLRRRIENDPNFAEKLKQAEESAKKQNHKAEALAENAPIIVGEKIVGEMHGAEKQTQIDQSQTHTQTQPQTQTQTKGALVAGELADTMIDNKTSAKTAYLSDFAFFEFAGLALADFNDAIATSVQQATLPESALNSSVEKNAAEEIVVAGKIEDTSVDNNAHPYMPDAQQLKSLYREVECREMSIAPFLAEHLPLTDREQAQFVQEDVVQQAIIQQEIIEQQIIQASMLEIRKNEEIIVAETIVTNHDSEDFVAMMGEESPIIDMIAEDEPLPATAGTKEATAVIEEATAIAKDVIVPIAQSVAVETAPHSEDIVEATAENSTAENSASNNVPSDNVISDNVTSDEVAYQVANAVVEKPIEEVAPTIETKAPPVAPIAVESMIESKPASKIVASLPKHNPAFIPKMVQKDYADYHFPTIDYLQEPVYQDGAIISQDTLERSAGLLESVLEDFGIKGEIIHVRPGPVVTLYEFEPAAGVKSSRVIGLSDDIARSMSAISARVAVIPGRNVIGIELPNSVRETVYLRELIASKAFQESTFKLPLALGKSIGGEPVIAELAKMPHLLVAGTTGSGKSVAINTMILSLLYRLTPDECRLIMVDPKMLELSIYDGIPHLLTPVVTDPKKAVTALKWAVREMEDRYRKMAKLGVRNIDGFNSRVAQAVEKGETIMCTVQSGFDKETGEMLYHEEAMDLTKLPFIVVIVDEMADLMMVAGKEIEGAIQRLAQMARAAGIHLIMATQRPSVDVITGTIKANFPTRISFQVTSKIDSRTILGEQGAETLLGQGDMLHMVGGGRIVRVHGPFVSDEEVEQVVAHLKTQGTPDYLATVTDGEEDEDSIDDAGSVADIVAAGNVGEDGEELYLQAVKVVMRDKKCSTSYIQRRLSIGYNKAASLVERMEKEGIVGSANHVGKREILLNNVPKHS